MNSNREKAMEECLELLDSYDIPAGELKITFEDGHSMTGKFCSNHCFDVQTGGLAAMISRLFLRK